MGTAAHHRHDDDDKEEEAIVPNFNLVTDVDLRQLVRDSCNYSSLIDQAKYFRLDPPSSLTQPARRSSTTSPTSQA